MTYSFLRNREFKILVTLTLVTMMILSCLSMLVPKVKADTYNQVPLWINVMEGATITGEQIDQIEATIDSIWKANGLNWRVTSIVLDESYTDPDKTRDQPGDIRVAESGETDEEKPIWGAGKNETKDKSGCKIFVARRILNETGNDTGTTGVAWKPKGTAIVAEPGAYAPPVGGDTWAHEIGHLFGLDHEKQNGTERPSNDLMGPYREDRTGTNLQQEDIDKMNKTKTEEELGLPTLTDEQRGSVYNMYRTVGEDAQGDAVYNFTDILDSIFGFYILDDVRTLHITTYLGGVIPLDFPWIYYNIALDTDNDPATGDEFEGWLGIDFLIEVSWSPPGIVNGTLYTYPGLVSVAPLETEVETHFKIFCTETSPAPPPLETHNSIVVSIPITLLEKSSLADPINIGTLLTEPSGFDKLELMPVSTSPPDRPTLILTPPVAPSGTLVSATGNGYAPTNSVSLIFNQVNLSTTTVALDGSFETSFTVPDLPLDHYMVDAIDESHNVGVSMFTVTTPPPVGGFWTAIDKLALLAPYIAITSTIIVATVTSAIYIKRRKKQ